MGMRLSVGKVGGALVCGDDLGQALRASSDREAIVHQSGEGLTLSRGDCIKSP